MALRTLVVGDVHGCREELEDLLDAARFEASEDQLVLVGDLVAKGPDSKGVLELSMHLGAHSARGNHDQHVLRWWEAKQHGEKPPELRDAHREVAEALDEAEWRWLESLPFWIDLEAHGALVVHAGLLPDVPLDEQDPFDLMNMRSIRSDGTASRDYEEGTPWAELWPGPKLVVFGHDAIRGLQRHPHAFGLDTGCVYGGWLTGLWLPERDLVSVPARNDWASPGET